MYRICLYFYGCTCNQSGSNCASGYPGVGCRGMGVGMGAGQGGREIPPWVPFYTFLCLNHTNMSPTWKMKWKSGNVKHTLFKWQPAEARAYIRLGKKEGKGATSTPSFLPYLPIPAFPLPSQSHWGLSPQRTAESQGAATGVTVAPGAIIGRPQTGSLKSKV